MRKFLATILICVMSMVTLPMTACNVTAAQLQADASALAAALTSTALVEQEQGADPTISAKLSALAQGIQAINWQSGNATAILNDAAASAEVVLALIPQTALVAPFIPIAIAMINVILANTPTSSASVTASRNLSAAYVLQAKKIAIKHWYTRDTAKTFKSVWNKQATKSNLPKMKIN